MPVITLKIDEDTITEVRFDESDVVQVERCDFITSQKHSMKRTDEGYLRGDAAVAKIGILKYLLPNGVTRSELVPPETLFNKSSTDTLQLQPITDRHPPELLLDKTTVKRRRVGTTGENIKQDEQYLVTSIVVTDEDAISNVESGRQQLSPGYRCDLVMQGGMYKGEKYDAVQTNRRYNHVAICNRARGGSDLKLNLDAVDDVEHLDGFEINEDAVLTTKRRQALPDSDFCFVIGKGESKIRKFPAHDAAHVRNALARLSQSKLTSSQKASVKACLVRKAKKFNIKVSQDSLHIDADIPEELYIFSSDEIEMINSRKEHLMPQFRIDGIDYEADQQVINHVTKLQTKTDELQTQLTASETKVTENQAKLDEATSKVTELEKRDTVKEISDGVSARLKLAGIANVVLDAEEMKKIDEKVSDLDIMKTVILKRSPSAKLDEKDEVYIRARFDAVVEGIDFDSDAIAKGRRDSALRLDTGNGDPVEKARIDGEDRIKNAWQNLPEQYTGVKAN